MATEVHNRQKLLVSLFIGSQQDITQGMPALAKLFPDNVEAAEDGWIVKGVDGKLFEAIKQVFKEDKVKFSEDFELNMAFCLGWVFSKRYTNLHLSQKEPAHHLTVQEWKWAGHKAKVKHDDGNDS